MKNFVTKVIIYFLNVNTIIRTEIFCMRCSWIWLLLEKCRIERTKHRTLFNKLYAIYSL